MLRKIVKTLADFGQGGRYYNLNVVLGKLGPLPSPEAVWQELELEVLQEEPNWQKLIVDPMKSDLLRQHINKRLTVHCERITRALSRLFTIGELGELAKTISPHTNHFLFLMDDDLGGTNYETIMI